MLPLSSTEQMSLQTVSNESDCVINLSTIWYDSYHTIGSLLQYIKKNLQSTYLAVCVEYCLKQHRSLNETNVTESWPENFGKVFEKQEFHYRSHFCFSYTRARVSLYTQISDSVAVLSSCRLISEKYPAVMYVLCSKSFATNESPVDCHHKVENSN